MYILIKNRRQHIQYNNTKHPDTKTDINISIHNTERFNSINSKQNKRYNKNKYHKNASKRINLNRFIYFCETDNRNKII